MRKFLLACTGILGGNNTQGRLVLCSSASKKRLVHLDGALGSRGATSLEVPTRRVAGRVGAACRGLPFG
eukprot:10240317-Heterocapsa_arctica.AAC.1